MPWYDRKNPRLETWDYSTPGSYFVTAVTHDRSCVFGEVVDARSVHETALVELTPIGMYCDETFSRIEEAFPGWICDKHVVMPNHFHAILTKLSAGGSGLSSVVNYLKGCTTRFARSRRPEAKIWQSSYHDHIVRDDDDYKRLWEYIEENPGRWVEDQYCKDWAEKEGRTPGRRTR